ncbi:MAG: hypothetical protein HGJ94_16275 [Desulfosarcina sp.]|nr:hypothetical protein [Desulfosarcina sp.]
MTESFKDARRIQNPGVRIQKYGFAFGSVLRVKAEEYSDIIFILDSGFWLLDSRVQFR